MKQGREQERAQEEAPLREEVIAEPVFVEYDEEWGALLSVSSDGSDDEDADDLLRPPSRTQKAGFFIAFLQNVSPQLLTKTAKSDGTTAQKSAQQVCARAKARQARSIS